MAELKLENIYKIYDNNVTAVTDFNLHIQDKNLSYLSFWMRKIYNITNGWKIYNITNGCWTRRYFKGEFSIDGKLMNDVPQKIAISQWSSKLCPISTYECI